MAVLWNFLDSSTSLMLLITAVTLIITLWYLYKRASVGNLPPGPKGLPYIGVLPALVGKNQFKVFTEWANKYGDIVSFEVMGERMILLNEVDLVREAFSKELFSGRPSGYLIDVINENMGLVGSEGALWKEHRRFTLSVLREFGMGNIKAEQIIQDELTHLISAIESKNGEPFNIQPILTTAACNIIYSIVFGRRYHYDDQKITAIRDGVAELSSNLQIMESVYSILYLLRHLPGDLFKFRKSNEIIKNIDNIVQEEIADHKASYQPEITRDFVDAFLHKMKKEDENSTFTEHQLMKTCFDLFIAGTEATDTTLLWSVLYLLHNPHVQTRAQADIDREIGTDARPSMKHRTSLPYVEAALNETMRYSSLAPEGIPHKNFEDCTLKGYRIPKHSVIIPNIVNIHFDTRYWQNPEKFSPDRFIDENGRVLKSEALIPFAVGKRSCPGESLAKMELFIFFSGLLQTFTFLPESEGNLPTAEPDIGSERVPHRFMLLAKKRF